MRLSIRFARAGDTPTLRSRRHLDASRVLHSTILNRQTYKHTGFPDGPPVKVGNSIADLVTGMAAAQGITLALLTRERTRRGQKVEIGMLDMMASLLTYQAGLYWNTGGRPKRPGNQHPSIVPDEVFKAQHAYLTPGVAKNSHWEKTCRAIEQPDLTRDPPIDTDANRVTNCDALIPLLNDVFGAR